MHKQAADRINFFMDKDPVFITAIIPMLTPVRVPGSEHIYFKDDIPEEIYFIIKGKVSFVHEKRNFAFVSFLEGSHFGDIEVLLESKRKFHAFCTSPCNLLALNYEGISVIQNEFQSIWQEMARNARKKENLLTIAVEQAVKICDMKSDMQLVNYTHEEVKEMYNDFIFTQVRRQKKTDHEEKQESPAEKLVNKLAEFGSEVKAINLKASVMCEKVRIIEKFLLGPEHVI
jgi:CRP-like cAMP-binding protein